MRNFLLSLSVALAAFGTQVRAADQVEVHIDAARPGPRIDSVNTFVASDTVVPKAVSGKVANGKVALSLAPESVTVVSFE